MRHVVKQKNITRKPLTEPVLLILTSVSDEPRHGYALIKDIESLSQGRVRLSTGTLYGAIRRLVETGWIEPFEQQDTSREKQAYRLTPEGRKELRAELERMKELTQKATARLKARRAEFAGVLVGSGSEWIAKWTTDVSVWSRHLPDLRMMPLPWVPQEARNRLLGRHECLRGTSQ